MKKRLIQFAPIIIGLTALADTQLEVLKGIGLTDVAINYIKLIGLISALCLPSIQSIFAKDETPPIEPPDDNDGIGGGGIKNPPKP